MYRAQQKLISITPTLELDIRKQEYIYTHIYCILHTSYLHASRKTH